jgi:monoamine oxidase
MMNQKIGRRRFLREAAAGSVVGPVMLTGKARAGTTRADVIVIGAGMSGVSAAWALQPHKHVIVLEGRPDRVGGRIWTNRSWTDEPVDLGASWLTHETVNPLRDLAGRWGIRTTPSDLLNFSLTEVNGRRLSMGEVMDFFALYGETYAEVKLISERRIAAGLPDIPASVAFKEVIARKRLPAAKARGLDFFINYGVKEPQASELKDLSLNYWDEDFVFVQAFTSVFPLGYVQLVEHMASGLDVRMDHAVSEIAYDSKGVTVTTKKHGKFFAPYAIVTLPLGVLKSPMVRFRPQLPAWKRGAIDRLGFGLSDKFYFRFPDVFWDREMDGVHRIAENSDAHWSTWLNFAKVPVVEGQPGRPTLMVFNRDRYAAQLETMSDSQVIDAAWSVLQKEYPGRALRPVGLLRSHWGKDPFARGTIPHVPPGASGRDYGLVGQPIGRLRFAGDSAHEDFPGLVLGAFLSGEREAGRILGGG